MNQTRMKPPVALPEGVLAARQPAAANLEIKRVLDTHRYARLVRVLTGRCPAGSSPFIRALFPRTSAYAGAPTPTLRISLRGSSPSASGTPSTDDLICSLGIFSRVYEAIQNFLFPELSSQTFTCLMGANIRNFRAITNSKWN